MVGCVYVYIYTITILQIGLNRHPAKSTEKDQDFDAVFGHTFNCWELFFSLKWNHLFGSHISHTFEGLLE